MNTRHIRVVRRIRPKARLAIASRDAKRAQTFKRRLRLDDAFENYSNAIDSNYSVIVLGIPPRTHAELLSKCLDAGKHVLVEKPAFQSLDEFRLLWKRMKQHTATVMIAENVHFNPFHRAIKTRLESGRFGRPFYHDLNRLGLHDPRGWRADPKEMPLGALHEGGVHWIRRICDLASVFEEDSLGGVVGVTAYRMPVTTRTPNEDTSIVVARHRSGWFSRLIHSWALPRRLIADTSKFVLEHGSIYYHPLGIWGRVQRTGMRFIPPKIRDPGGYRAMWSHFLECVEHGTAPKLTLEHIWGDFAFLEAAYRSMESGREEQPSPLPKLALS